MDTLADRTSPQLLPALRRLDALLERAIAAARFGDDDFRGLHVSDVEAEALLVRRPGVPSLDWDGKAAEPSLVEPGKDSCLDWLRATFSLSSFDVDVILIAVAPEIDLRYERLYAYLQDDVTRKRPTLDLALSLLCDSAQARSSRRAHVLAGAPLVEHGLIQLVPETHHAQPSLLSHSLKPDEQVLDLFFGHQGVDTRLAAFCELLEPRASENQPTSSPVGTLFELVRHALHTHWPLAVHFSGIERSAKRRCAEALAAESQMKLLIADLARVSRADLAPLLGTLLREALFHDAILFLDDVDAIYDNEDVMRCLAEHIARYSAITILAGQRPWTPSGHRPQGVFSVPFPAPGFEGRRALWTAGLRARGVPIEPDDVDTLADRFRLSSAQITNAIATVSNRHLSDVSDVQPGHLFAAARAQCGHELAELTQRIQPVYTWNDIVLDDDTRTSLVEICQRIMYRHQVLDVWGFDGKLSSGKGTSVLFAGASGTGKTMAAEVIANEAGLDLYKIDLSGVVSKYIGETEKNLDQIFAAADDSNAILFFDEADALFGKRSEVRDSHDRYANIEISYLLQKMEHYEGVTILATNIRQNLDESFIRRMAFSVHFPFPSEGDRRLIWSRIWPAQTPLAGDVDFDLLAQHFKLSGGNIKNAALAAAFLAAADGGAVRMDHLFRAIRREYQKLGKSLTDTELYGDYADKMLSADPIG